MHGGDSQRVRDQQRIELISHAVECTTDLICITDLNDRFIFANKAFLDAYGYTETEILGQRPTILASSNSLSGVTAEIMASTRRGGWRGELFNRRKDGAEFPISLSTSIIRDPLGQPLGLVGVAHDITEQYQAREALQRAEAEYRSLFENAIEGIVRSTPAGQFVRANPAMARMLGYESTEALRSAIHDLERQVYADPEKRREFRRIQERDGFVKDFECQWVRRDGRKIWVSITARAIRDSQEKTQYYEGFVEDVTTRKVLEAQLRQSQKMEAIGLLAGGIAHDFNNLLTVIIGCSDVLDGQPSVDASSKELVREIRKAGERAANLTHQLLAFSRKQILQPENLLLNRLVAETEKMLRRLIGENIRLGVHLDANLGYITADPVLLEQIILNLAVNARDAMPEGGDLRISTANCQVDEAAARDQPGLAPGAFVVLEISDTGCGMDEATKARIFEPFFTTKEQGKGTGLGLATVYGSVKQSGGYIEVRSDAGQGSTFRIYLPRARGGGKAEPSSVHKELNARGAETVLLAEDEDAVRAFTALVLRSNGYQVLEARNGPDALRISQEYTGPIALLVTDVIMPQMSGRKLAELLTPARPDLRVIYLSGYTDDDLFQQGVSKTETAFVQKPFSAKTLTQMVREVLDREHQR